MFGNHTEQTLKTYRRDMQAESLICRIRATDQHRSTVPGDEFQYPTIVVTEVARKIFNLVNQYTCVMNDMLE